MSNTGFKGVDVRQTGSQLVFRASLKDSTGAKVTSGTTTLAIYELQSDGTFKSYDFNSNTFKTTALTTATASMSHQTGNNGTVNTGVWTYALSTLTGFTAGAVYLAQVNNSGALPTDQEREFQYGSAEGDLVTTAGSTGQAYLQSQLADAVVHGGTTATFRLGASGATPAFLVTNSGGPAVKFQATGGNNSGFICQGNAFGPGAIMQGGASGAVGLDCEGGGSTSGAIGFYAAGYGGGAAFIAGTNGPGIYAFGTGGLADIELIGTGTIHGALTGSVGSVTGNVGGNVVGTVASVVGAVGSVTGNVGGSVASVVAGVTVTTNNDKTGYSISATGLALVVPTEPSGAPSWGTTTIVGWMAWLGALAYNKVTQTSSTQTLRNSADNANIATAAVSDDNTTFVRGKWS